MSREPAEPRSLLTFVEIAEAPVAVVIEFDVPALRAILDYADDEVGADGLLYWNVGAGSPRDSAGIDLDARSGRIVLVELRLYGGRIAPWPPGWDDLPEQRGAPVVDKAPWSTGSEFLDVPGGFLLQTAPRRLRLDFSGAPAARRVRVADSLAIDLDAERRVCAVSFLALEPDIVEALVSRYGSAPAP